MSFWNKLFGKKKSSKSIVVYERENKKLWDYVRLLTELLEEKDKEIKELNEEIQKIEEDEVKELKKGKTTKKPSSKTTKKKSTSAKSSKKSTKAKKKDEDNLSREEIIVKFLVGKKDFFDYKQISDATGISQGIVRTMISRLKKKGHDFEEKKEGKKKLIKLKN